MSEREYPRWIHCNGHKSVVAETADDEATILSQWDEEDAASLSPNAVAGTMSPGDQITFAQPVQFLDGSQASKFVAASMPKKGGWPKGKPRGNRQDAVN